MPFKKQYGYVYTENTTNLTKTIAHELGHGAFRLRHTFSEEAFIANQNSTDNLMDYKPNGTDLYKHQWDLVHDPERMIGWLEDDEEGEMEVGLEYEFVVSPFLSSVTILASALGSKILVLNNYQYCTYGIEQLDFQSMYSAPTLRAMVSTYVRSGTESESVEIAENVLGKKFLENYDISKENFLDEINSVRKPLYVHSAGGSRTSAYVLSNIARLSGRSGFLKYGITAGVRYKVFGTQNSIICKKINMIDAAINGLSEKNFSIRVLTDKERNAVPGQGADW
jgi:hypothetical protein